MNKKIIVTNNPMLPEELNGYKIIFVNSLSDVYHKTRDLIHKNWKLVSHPLAGSVKPAQNPYRTVILIAGADLDFYSLDLIESAIYKLKQFDRKQKDRIYSKRIKEDYQLIDLTFINSALKKHDLLR